MKTELSIAENLEAISALAPEISEQLPYLQMLILFGSRATGKATDTSDFDIAVSYDEDLQEKFTKDKPYGFIEAYSVIPKVLGINSDRLDIVDLGHYSDVSMRSNSK